MRHWRAAVAIIVCLGFTQAAPAGEREKGEGQGRAEKKRPKPRLPEPAADSPHLVLPFDPLWQTSSEGPSAQSNTACPQTEGFAWHASASTNGLDMGWAAAASCTGIYEAGYTTGALPGATSAGSNDLFIRKLDSEGAVLWARQFGTPVSDNATAVATTGCPRPFIYVAGYTSGSLRGTSQGGSDLFLIKLADDGSEVWGKQLGAAQLGSTTANEQLWGMALDAAGNIYVTGSTSGNLAGLNPAPPAGTTSLFIVKFDPSGTVLWTRQLGVNNRTTVARGIAVGANGDVYVAGHTNAGLGGQAYAGGGADAFIVRYSSSGTLLGTRLLGTSAQDQAFALTTAQEGGQTFIYATGTTNGSFSGYTNDGPNYDLFLVKLDAALSRQWLTQEGTSENISVNAILYLDDTVFVAGATRRNLATNAALGSSDMLLAQYKPNGARRHVSYLGNGAQETAQALTADPSGNLFLTGATDGSFCNGTFGGGVRDALTLKFLGGCLVNTPDPSCYVGGGWGDPHYFNFDGLAFDFQAGGDFILAAVAGDPSLQVQVRQCPWFPGAWVSTFKAVAVRLESDVVEYQGDGSLYVNGAAREPVTDRLALAGGGLVYPAAGGGYVFAWPRGDRLVARPFGSYMNLYLIVPATRRGLMRGLLGNADGDAGNDYMVSRDGTDLRDELTFAEMYHDFASYTNAWRVQGGDVPLITHGTACSPSVPAQPMTLGALTPAQRAQGEAACAGVADPTLRESCIIDVGATGDDSFAGAVQDVVTRRTNQGQVTPVISGPKNVYFNNFAGEIGPEWSSITTGTTPLGDRVFLGEFGNETVRLTLNNLGPHTQLTVSFDLFIINGWDGDGFLGPHTWSAAVDGSEVASYTFSNTFSSQSYPLVGSAPATGALEANTLFYPYGDSVYRIKLTFPHTAADVALDLSASGLTGYFFEAWGVTNFEVQGR